MRFALPLALLLAATPAAAADPMPLSPYAWMGGFAPYKPAPVAAGHPLFGKIALAPIVSMPNRVGGTFILVTRPKELTAALRETLAKSNMLAADGTAPKATLEVSWVDFDLPFKIGMSSKANVTIHYELKRVDTGEVIFNRDVTTSAELQGGGDASIRARAAGRAAILGNVAGALWCLDQAAYGRAPMNCASQPLGSFTIQTTRFFPIFVPR